jgi:hypothetical protein
VKESFYRELLLSAIVEALAHQGVRAPGGGYEVGGGGFESLGQLMGVALPADTSAKSFGTLIDYRVGLRNHKCG